MLKEEAKLKQEIKTKLARDSVLDQSAKLFAEKGYDQTSMQDIMAATNMSKGAIYHHFKSKEEILNLLTKRAQLQVENFFQEVAQNLQLNTKEKILTIFKFLTTNEASHNLILANWLDKVPFALVNSLRSGNQNLAPILAEILQAGIQQEEIICKNPQFAAELIILLVDIWLDPNLFQRTTEELRERCDYLLDLIQQLVVNLLDAETKQAILAML